MPGFYNGDDYDLAGFAVGIVEKSLLIDGSNVKEGNILIALPSTGPHSNGYSLIRKILDFRPVYGEWNNRNCICLDRQGFCWN